MLLDALSAVCALRAVPGGLPFAASPLCVFAGIDHLLAQHVAHLFIRDPLTLFEEKIHLDDANESDHFENIQSTNWQTMRFKPPPPNSDIGWRVEFRPMEVRLMFQLRRCCPAAPGLRVLFLEGCGLIQKQGIQACL